MRMCLNIKNSVYQDNVRSLETAAAYGELYFELSDKVALMGGSRYFKTDRKQESADETAYLSLFQRG